MIFDFDGTLRTNTGAQKYPTRPEEVQALKGRASYLGPRSVGHEDPGAASSVLLLTALRDGRFVGATGTDGRVIVPPTEYDPDTGDDTGEVVEVGPGGVVESWAWVSHPLRKHPLQTPFAWALVRLDGAALLPGVDPQSPRTHEPRVAEKRGRVRAQRFSRVAGTVTASAA